MADYPMTLRRTSRPTRVTSRKGKGDSSSTRPPTDSTTPTRAPVVATALPTTTLPTTVPTTTRATVTTTPVPSQPSPVASAPTTTPFATTLPANPSPSSSTSSAAPSQQSSFVVTTTATPAEQTILVTYQIGIANGAQLKQQNALFTTEYVQHLTTATEQVSLAVATTMTADTNERRLRVVSGDGWLEITGMVDPLQITASACPAALTGIVTGTTLCEDVTATVGLSIYTTNDNDTTEEDTDWMMLIRQDLSSNMTQAIERGDLQSSLNDMVWTSTAAGENPILILTGLSLDNQDAVNNNNNNVALPQDQQDRGVEIVTPASSSGSNETIGGGIIAAVVLAATLVVLLSMFLVVRRRELSNQQQQESYKDKNHQSPTKSRYVQIVSPVGSIRGDAASDDAVVFSDDGFANNIMHRNIGGLDTTMDASIDMADLTNADLFVDSADTMTGHRDNTHAAAAAQLKSTGTGMNVSFIPPSITEEEMGSNRNTAAGGTDLLIDVAVDMNSSKASSLDANLGLFDVGFRTDQDMEVSTMDSHHIMPRLGIRVLEKQAAVDRVQREIQAGEWAAVGVTAALLTHMSDSQSAVSSQTSHKSRGSDASDDQLLGASRAAELDDLVETEDWEGLATAVSRFQAEDTKRRPSK